MKKLILILLYLVTLGWGATWNSDSVIVYKRVEDTICFYFSQQYTFGYFADSSIWVVSDDDTVRIDSITPTYINKTNNGWMVNPEIGPQAYSNKFSTEAGTCPFDSNLCPNFPAKISAPATIIKSITTGTDAQTPRVRCFMPLTVLSEIPENDGIKFFRPPYISSYKPLISIDSIHSTLLPSLNQVPEAPTFAWIERRFKYLQMDMYPGALGIEMHADTNFVFDRYYGGTIGLDCNDAILRFFLNDPWENKRQSVIYFVQYGIDNFYNLKNGQTWPAGGGMRPDDKIAIIFSSWILNNQEMKDSVFTHRWFGEDYIVESYIDGDPVYGEQPIYSPDTLNMWKYMAQESTPSRSMTDGVIDGGVPPATYFPAMGSVWTGDALIMNIVPALKQLYNDTLIYKIGRRYFTYGFQYDDDTLAPITGLWRGAGPKNGTKCNCASITRENYATVNFTVAPYHWVIEGKDTCFLSMDGYGVEFGPGIGDHDTSDGIGRYPKLKGGNFRTAELVTNFVKNMMTTYWVDDHSDNVRDSVITIYLRRKN